MIFARKRAASLHTKGQKHWDDGNDDEALKFYKKSLKRGLDSWGSSFFGQRFVSI